MKNSYFFCLVLVFFCLFVAPFVNAEDGKNDDYEYIPPDWFYRPDPPLPSPEELIKSGKPISARSEKARKQHDQVMADRKILLKYVSAIGKCNNGKALSLKPDELIHFKKKYAKLLHDGSPLFMPYKNDYIFITPDHQRGYFFSFRKNKQSTEKIYKDENGVWRNH